MVGFMRAWMAPVVALTLVTGCGHRISAKRIAEIEVPKAAIENPTFEAQRVLVRRFTEGRPDEHGRNLPGGGLFVGGHVSEYTTGYREKDGRDSVRYDGWLPMDIPYLLKQSLPGDNVVVADELPDAGNGETWDYVVEGRLTKSRSTWRGAVVWLWVSIVGTPSQAVRYELAYELRVFRGSDPDHAVLTRTYAFDERFMVGLYYNNKRMNELPLLALRATVSETAQDLVTELSKHRGRQRPTPIAAPPPNQPQE